jgi:hypothetical protein
MRVRALCVSLAVLFAAAPAWAQSDEQRAAARELATDGVRAFDDGRFDDAVDRFTRAEEIIHAPPHLLFLARAQAKLGRLVRAHETYVKIARESLPDGAPKAFYEAQTAAEEEEKLLAPRLAHLTIAVTGSAQAPVVTMDGVVVPSALVGVAHPVDPGKHVFEVHSAAAKSAPIERAIAEGETATVALALDDVEPVTTPTVASEHLPHDAPPSRGGPPVAAWAALGVGAVGLIVGTVFVVDNHANRNDATALCPGGVCPTAKRADVQALDDKADRAATIAWIGYGVGVAGVGVGAALWILSRSNGERAPARASASIYAGPSSIGLQGSF